MGTISVSLPSDGETIDAADYNTPINTIVNEINGALDNSNISASAAIATSKLATDAGIATGMIADDAVTPAKWTNPYCFRAYSSGNTTLTDNAWVKIALASESYDYNSNFTGSTYTAPVAGVYHFDGSVAHASVSVSPLFACSGIYVNGAETLSGTGVPASTSTIPSRFTVSGDILLAANDTVELWHYQNSAGNELTSNSTELTWFSGHLVHAT